MPCKDCLIFHDGILKGECRCNNCNCNKQRIWQINKELNTPITSTMESCDKS